MKIVIRYAPLSKIMINILSAHYLRRLQFLKLNILKLGCLRFDYFGINMISPRLLIVRRVVWLLKGNGMIFQIFKYFLLEQELSRRSSIRIDLQTCIDQKFDILRQAFFKYKFLALPIWLHLKNIMRVKRSFFVN